MLPWNLGALPPLLGPRQIVLIGSVIMLVYYSSAVYDLLQLSSNPRNDVVNGVTSLLNESGVTGITSNLNPWQTGSSKLASEVGITVNNGVCSKGQPPWSKSWILSELEPFLQAFDQRPADNKLGTPIMHQFAMWCIVRKLQPRHIIESGVLHGLGTWLLRQAAPQAQLILLDPTVNLDLVYTDRNNDTLYFTGRRFRDFASARYWSDVDIDFSQTLAFIDDHHTPLMRIPHARRVGIRHMIFEDNYWLGFYDCFSMKQACACVMGWRECANFKYKDAYGAQKRLLRHDDITSAAKIFKELNIYNEFPMMWNVWHEGVTMVSKQSTNYLFAETNGSVVLGELRLHSFPPESHLNGKYTYANIAYVELRYD